MVKERFSILALLIMAIVLAIILFVYGYSFTAFMVVLLAAIAALIVLAALSAIQKSNHQLESLKTRVSHLKQAEKDKTEILSLVAHQLKTPLALIRWSTESVLHNTKLTKKERERLEESIGTTHVMYRTIEDLSHTFKLIGKAGRQYLKYERIDVDDALAEMLSEYKSVAKQHRIKIKLIKPNKDIFINVDRIFFKHAIANLVDNALKYSPAGSTVTITIKRERANVTIAVADSGIGISTVDQKRIFERFFRSDEARKVHEHGTGLGLYLVQTIIHKLNGHIELKSTLGRGTTFTVTLPTS